ncbi:hypothetical protein [Mycolicibacterium goodii]|uniref:hypothetical protein n=1 Tax=Mycolicibacterium goodii TaxID=134601 RepID=UPI00138F57FC
MDTVFAPAVIPSLSYVFDVDARPPERVRVIHGAGCGKAHTTQFPEDHSETATDLKRFTAIAYSTGFAGWANLGIRCGIPDLGGQKFWATWLRNAVCSNHPAASSGSPGWNGAPSGN